MKREVLVTVPEGTIETALEAGGRKLRIFWENPGVVVMVQRLPDPARQRYMEGLREVLSIFEQSLATCRLTHLVALEEALNKMRIALSSS